MYQLINPIRKPLTHAIAYCLVVLTMLGSTVACKKKKDTAATKPAKGDESGETRGLPDTRFQDKFFAAQLEKSKDNLEKAYKLFEECLALQPTNDAVHYEIGRMDLQVLNNPNAALVHAKAATEGNPKNPWYQLLLGDTYMALAKYDLATKAYKDVARLNTNDTNILYQIATAQLYDNKVNDAIATYNELENQSGPYEELSMQKHQLYLKLNEPEKAGLEIEKLAKAFPEEPRYWGLAAQFYTTIKQPEKAKNAMQEMVKSDPHNGQVHFQLSEYYASVGDDKSSYDELKKSFGTTDISIDQKVNVLLKYFSLTDFNPAYLPQAYELLDLTEQMHPMEAKAFSISGDFLYREGRDIEALQKYRKAASLDPSRSAIWEQIVALDNEVKDYNNMAIESEKAIELFPNTPQFYYYNGLANTKKKNYSKAVESFNLGKELVVENDILLAQFYSSLGEVYHLQNVNDKSDEAYEKALKLQPDNVFVLNNYAYYLSLRKIKLDQAAAMAARANELSPDQATFQDTYAWILFQQGKYSDALVWINKALDIEENGDLLEHQGDILFKLNRTNDALNAWKAAVAAGNSSSKLSAKINEQKYIE